MEQKIPILSKLIYLGILRNKSFFIWNKFIFWELFMEQFLF
jgi:hypothetical protein